MMMMSADEETTTTIERHRSRGRHQRRRIWFSIACVTALFMLTLLPPVVESFQLRDPKQKDAGDGGGGGSIAAGVSKSAKPAARTLFKDMPMRKIARIVKDIDPDPVRRAAEERDDGDDDDEENDDDDDDDSEEPFVFEKVHSTHFELREKPTPPVATLSQPDVEQDEAEAKEEAESGEQVSSVLDPLWQWTQDLDLLPDFDWLPDVDGVLDWLQALRQKEEAGGGKAKAKKDDETDKEDKDEGDDGLMSTFWSYLDRKPFNTLLQYIDKDFLIKRKPRRDDDDDSPDAGGDRAGASSEKREPISVHHFENLLLTVPSFVPNYTNVASSDCRRMGQIFQRQVRGERLWALQMMDASGKIPAGLLRGNANQLGDFDQCLEIRTKVKLRDDKAVKVKGKYCLASIAVEATADAMRLPVHLLLGRNLLRSHLDDPAHYLPRFSTVKWALCLPHLCSADDAEAILVEMLAKFNEDAGVELQVHVDEADCTVRTRRSWSDLIKADWQMSAAIGYFTFFLVVTVIATLNDYWQVLRLDVLLADPEPAKEKSDDADNEETAPTTDDGDDAAGTPNNDAEEDGEHDEQDEKKKSIDVTDEADDSGFTHRMLMSFSLKHTVRQLFTFDAVHSDDTIYCIYGLKGLATILLYFSLKALLLGHVPFSNRTQLTEMLNTPLSVFVRVGAVLYADVFLLASGFFAGYKLQGDVTDAAAQRTPGSIPWLRRFGARAVRLLPAGLAVVLFSGWIWPHLDAGPQWSQLVGRNAELCREPAALWRHVFFVQNWWPAEEQCAPHLAHVALDMQLFVVAPAIVWLLERDAAWGFGVFGVLNGFAVGVRFARTVAERLSVVVFQGMKLTQFYRTINMTLTSPLQRATAHLIGVGLGVMLQQSGRDVRIPKAIFVTGWLMCIWSVVWCFWAPAHLAHRDYVYDPDEAAAYGTWAPLLWSLAISWIVFVVYTRNDGLMTRCLTARPLIFLSRVSYVVFCVQPLVLLWSAAQVRQADAFGWATWFNVTEMALVLGLATVCTLIFDLPLQSIARMIVAEGRAADVIAVAAAAAEEEQKLAEQAEKDLQATKEAAELSSSPPVSEAETTDLGSEEEETSQTDSGQRSSDNYYRGGSGGRGEQKEEEEEEEEVEKKTSTTVTMPLRKVSFSPVEPAHQENDKDIAEEEEEEDEEEDNDKKDEEKDDVQDADDDAEETKRTDQPNETGGGDQGADPPVPVGSVVVDAEDEEDEDGAVIIDADPAGGETRAKSEQDYQYEEGDDADIEYTDEDYSARTSDDFSDEYSEEADVRAQIWRNNY